MHILLVKTSAIGDVTHTLPALNAIRHRYPHARITWLVEEAAAGVIEGHHALDRVLISRRKGWIKQFHNGEVIRTLKEIMAFIREVRDTEYDLVIDFQNLLKSGIFVALAKAGRKAGFGRGMEHAECSHLFLNERIAPVSMDMHAIDRELHLLRALGIESQEVIFDFPVDYESEEHARLLLAQAGFKAGVSLVAINPVATWETKCWFNDRFSEVAQRLIDQGHGVLFTGGLADKPVIEEILRPLDPSKAINLAGATSIKTLAALYQKMKTVISTDTGPMHIAAAVGTPVIALFGPTAPCRTGPYGKGHHILRADLGCSPCFKKNCTTRLCMRALHPDDVMRVFSL